MIFNGYYRGATNESVKPELRDFVLGQPRTGRLVDLVEFGLADDLDDDFPQQFGSQHRHAVADGVDEVVVPLLLDDGRVEQRLLQLVQADDSVMGYYCSSSGGGHDSEHAGRSGNCAFCQDFRGIVLLAVPDDPDFGARTERC